GDSERAVERRALRHEADIGEHRGLALWVAAEHADLALGRAEEARREREQGRLAGRVRPREPDDRPGRDLEGAVAQPPLAAEALPEAAREERRHATRRASFSRSVAEISALMLSSSSPVASAASS